MYSYIVCILLERDSYSKWVNERTISSIRSKFVETNNRKCRSMEEQRGGAITPFAGRDAEGRSCYQSLRRTWQWRGLPHRGQPESKQHRVGASSSLSSAHWCPADDPLTEPQESRQQRRDCPLDRPQRSPFWDTGQWERVREVLEGQINSTGTRSIHFPLSSQACFPSGSHLS